MIYPPPAYVQAKPAFDVYVRDKKVAFGKAQPLRRGKLRLIPLRETVLAMGGSYTPGPIGRVVYLALGSRRVALALDGGESRVGGMPRALESRPWISRGEVVVPAGFFSEAMHVTVVTNPKQNLIRLFPSGGFRAPRRIR